MFVTGFGIGLVMQVLVVAVQNAVGYEDLGVATSGNTLFRNIGSSVGTAVIGTIFATELASRWRRLPPRLGGPAQHVPPQRGHLGQTPAGASTTPFWPPTPPLDTAFKVAGFVSIVAFIASWFIRELPMRTTLTTEDLGARSGPLARRLAVGDPPGPRRPGRPTADAPMAPGWPPRPAWTFRSRTAGCWSSCAGTRSRPGGAGRQSEDRALRAQRCGRHLLERGLLTDAAAGTLVDVGRRRRRGRKRRRGRGRALPAAAIPTVSLSPSGAVVADQIIDTVRNRLDSFGGLVAGAVPRAGAGPGPVRLGHRPGHARQGVGRRGTTPLDSGN